MGWGGRWVGWGGWMGRWVGGWGDPNGLPPTTSNRTTTGGKRGLQVGGWFGLGGEPNSAPHAPDDGNPAPHHTKTDHQPCPSEAPRPWRRRRWTWKRSKDLEPPFVANPTPTQPHQHRLSLGRGDPPSQGWGPKPPPPEGGGGQPYAEPTPLHPPGSRAVLVKPAPDPAKPDRGGPTLTTRRSGWPGSPPGHYRMTI